MLMYIDEQRQLYFILLSSNFQLLSISEIQECGRLYDWEKHDKT